MSSPREQEPGSPKRPPAGVEIQRRYFDSVADVFAATPPPDVLKRLERVVTLAGLRPGERVLDVGSGTGVLLPYILKQEPSRVVACDLSQEMLAVLKKRFPQVETALGDITRLDLPAGSFDCAFLNAVFPNLPEKPAALANLARLLASGGRMVISHPEGREFVLRLKDELPFPVDPLPGKPDLRRLLAPHPFRLELYLDEPRLYVSIARRK
jgi:SAM-dependent methyltransferase